MAVVDAGMSGGQLFSGHGELSACVLVFTLLGQTRQLDSGL